MPANAEQIMKTGRVNSRLCMNMILQARREKNLTREFINRLSSRHRGLVYFYASIPKSRHKFKFEELEKIERKQVINSLRDLRELFKSIPSTLLDSDSDI
ncbi:DUF5347 domain-containing protein [Erwinia tracheiphila]|uniref:Uncharacterized protein n=1 Tax=Erwinia tracheiphila TaxID=65700 RepID=A0A345CPF0_9GAMM|nr:DUF5347 family protein [Erwinia tracheiphila]AXF75317.1 hypothetical protein AV903_03115 [Erwinia tracheiphila]UIA82138.1 DUF5347 domain-containing protein [Erwinia tracheiphila]UIA90732.1 DUF5347 domain-containing protein [Erwinia tracheiphila]